MTPIWGNGGRQTTFAKTLLDIPKEKFKIVLTVADMLDELCSCGRELCWRELGLKHRKLCLLHVLWSVRIYFEQTTYTDVITFHYCCVLQEMGESVIRRNFWSYNKNLRTLSKIPKNAKKYPSLNVKYILFLCICCPCHKLFFTWNTDTWKSISFTKLLSTIKI
jgi:hypothetical protein